ncbi:MAG TPA: LptF/LptG family permease [Clostridia bacterium]|nr:LptF/LptG family permease [Clostridia bacterium]
MKTLHRYLTRQVIASLLMTVAVFTFVLMLGNALKEILPLLVTGQVNLGTVAKAIGLLIPFVLVFALPMGMLTATLLIFGRFSADQELTAVRAGGISLISLITPVMILSLFLCGVSAFVSMYLGPRCRVAYTRMLDNLRMELSSGVLPEGRFINDFPGYIFYAGRNRDGDLRDVMVFVLKNETNVETTIRAPRGKLEINTARQMLSLNLYDGKLMTITDDKPIPLGFEEWAMELDYAPEEQRTGKPKIDDMTFAQLREERRNLERLVNLPIPLDKLTPEQMATWKKVLQQQKKDLTAPVVFHMHRQAAFSFACFAFTLIGIPLGIRVHRRETNVGIAIALVLVAVYFSFILLSQSLESHAEWAPHLIVWLPNFIFQAAGMVLLWRANKGV